MVISRNAFARLLNVSQPCVSKYVKAGMPTVDGGVDRDVAMIWVRSHITPQAGIHSHKGADRAYELLRGHSADFDALASAESVLAPVADAVWQEVVQLGERVAAMVRDLDDPKEIEAIARDEARKLLARLARMPIEAGNGRG